MHRRYGTMLIGDAGELKWGAPELYGEALESTPELSTIPSEL